MESPFNYMQNFLAKLETISGAIFIKQFASYDQATLIAIAMTTGLGVSSHETLF